MTQESSPHPDNYGAKKNLRCAYCEIDDDRSYCFNIEHCGTHCDFRGYGCPDFIE